MVTKSWTWLSSHAILLIRKLKLLQDNTDCSWKNQDSNSGLFYSKVILTWEQENNFPIILSPLLPSKPFLNELWDPCEKIKTKMIKCLLALKFCQFPLHDSHIPRPTCVCIFTQKSHNTGLISSIFCFSYDFWHRSELFRLLVADSPRKLQGEVQQGKSWLCFALCHAVYLTLFLFLFLSLWLQSLHAVLCTEWRWIIHVFSEVKWKFPYLLNCHLPKSNINLIQIHLGKYCTVCSSIIGFFSLLYHVFKVPRASAYYIFTRGLQTRRMSLQHGSEMLEIHKTQAELFQLITQEKASPLPWK